MDVKMLEIILSKPIIPEQLTEIVAKATEALPAAGTEGVVISGRMPVWVFATLTHEYHPRPFVATFDPRLGGAVVVATHTPQVGIGQVVSLEGVEKIAVEF